MDHDDAAISATTTRPTAWLMGSQMRRKACTTTAEENLIQYMRVRAARERIDVSDWRDLARDID